MRKHCEVIGFRSMETSSPYAPSFRPVLIADAMITAVNRYPQTDVRLLPVLDTLALLIQRPLCFSFFRKNKSGKYQCLRTTLCDPDLASQFGQILQRLEKTGANLIAVPQTDVFLSVHEIKPRQENGLLNAQFPELADTEPFKALFQVLAEEESGLGKDVLHHIAQSLKNPKQTSSVRPSESGNGSYWADRRRLLRRVSTHSLIELVKPVVNGALALVSDSPLIKSLPGKKLPFDNLFSVFRSATNDTARRLCFSYTAQVLLSENQKRAIAATIGETVPSLIELPLGPAARAIADSVFHSGTVDFSDEQAGEGRDIPSKDEKSPDWKRQQAEAQVYAAITKNPHVFYVPIHVSGVPWCALFTISPRTEETGTWAHNYAIYRSLITGVAENIRALAKSTFLGLVKESFLEEYRKQDQSTFVRRTNDRWEELLLVFPFPAVRLVSVSEQCSEESIILPDGSRAEVETSSNRWFPSQVEYEDDVLDRASIGETLADALAEVEKEVRAARAEWKAQEHTIFNRDPLSYLRDAEERLRDAEHPSKRNLLGTARQNVEDARRAAEAMHVALSIACGRTGVIKLENRVGALLTWLNEHTLSGELRAELEIPSLENDFELPAEGVSHSFTVLWNLWHNASKWYGLHRPKNFWAHAGWDNDRFLVRFENEGGLGESYINYLLDPDAPSPQNRTHGLMIVKTKMQILGWRFEEIVATEERTRIVIRIGTRAIQ